MADAVLWDILTTVQSSLQDDVTFQAQGSEPVRTIKNESIVINKFPSLIKNKRTPGIIVTPPKQVTADPFAGENTRDDVVYPVLCQGIDRDAQHKSQGLRTYLKWQEQVAKLFRHAGLSGISISGNEGGVVWNCYVSQVSVVDRGLWDADSLFVWGVELRFISREPRGAS